MSYRGEKRKMSNEQMLINLRTLIENRQKIRDLTGRYDTEYLDNLINFLKRELDIDDIDCIM